MVKYIKNGGSFLCLFLIIISCEKEKSKGYENVSSTEYFSISTKLSNLKNLKKLKINDSLYEVRGYFNSFEITGQVKKNNIRTGWWEAKNQKTKTLMARLEYRLIDNKEFVNQYILFEHGKIDTLKSKFYSFEKNINSVKYKFYTPSQSKEIRSEGKLYYGYSSNNKKIKHLECKCIKNRNSFDCEFPIPVNSSINNLIIRGNFWQMFQLENGDIGENDIYILDTLNMKTINQR